MPSASVPGGQHLRHDDGDQAQHPALLGAGEAQEKIADKKE